MIHATRRCTGSGAVFAHRVYREALQTEQQWLYGADVNLQLIMSNDAMLLIRARGTREDEAHILSTTVKVLEKRTP